MKNVRTKDETARELARSHFSIDSALTEIYRVRSAHEDDPAEPIKLLEVSTSSTETGKVDAFLFTPDHDVEYWTIIAEVTPRELGLIRLNALELPEGWDLRNEKPFTRSEFFPPEAKTGT
jgi:hypothetical protein